MLHLIPAPLHRLLLRTAHALRIRWWELRKPLLQGVRVLVRDGQGQVLLIRHSYGSGSWMLPGGGIGWREGPLAAAARELREETGCKLASPRVIAVPEEPFHGAVNRVHVVAGHTISTPRADGREIVEARFFALDALPAPLLRGLAADLPVWLATADAVTPSGP